MAVEARSQGAVLRSQRERLGMTQAQVAEQLARLAWFRRNEHVGVNADMVSKWERGTKAVSQHYQALLCELFGATPEQLTFRKAPMVPTPEFAENSAGITALLTNLGDAADLLGSAVLDTWKEEALKRRTLLKLLSASPAAAIALHTGDRVVRKNSVGIVNGLDELADKYQALYHSTAPLDLMAPVVTHLRTIGALLRKGPAPFERRQLLRNRSRVATLAGRMAFFDLDDPMSARGYYNMAAEAAREANDNLLAAAALGHLSFIPAAEHSFVAAQDYLRGAGKHVAASPHGGVASWLAAVETEIHTNSGSELAALTAAERAREALSAEKPGSLPWFDYYDASRLSGFRGYALVRFGRLDEASAALTEALEALPTRAIKQRAVFLSDLASVQVEAREIDEACRIAGEAADALQFAGYATGTDRLRDLRTRLEPWKSHPGVRALDERIAAA